MHTIDDFLGGRVRLKQSLTGLRATSDSVLIASAVRAKSGDTVLDVGIGNGVISLCLNARIKGLKITGIDCQPDLVDLAQENAHLNHCDLDLILGDISRQESPLHGRQFHHVITNPPFYDEPHPRQNAQLAKAYHQNMALGSWIAYCLKHVRAKGTFTMMARPESMIEVLNALSPKLGSIEVIPIVSKAGEPAKRIIVRGVMNSRGSLVLRYPLLMHLKNGKRTPFAEKILRDLADID
ncbi:MAG: methyltransferase [Pseudomonadota bacterium]|nr:methyltransferase [Pseudomonadota bacterium]